MLQRVLQSKLLWSLIGIVGRYQFKYCNNGYIRLIGKRGKSVKHTDGCVESGYQPYLRLSYDRWDNTWYYREDGMVGYISYQDMIRMSKSFIKYDKLRAIRCY
jgi:hypothetical protein